MEPVLVIVTLLSLGGAVALLALNWRLVQEERLRSEARVDALRSAAAEHADPAVLSSHDLFHVASNPGVPRRAVALSAIAGTVAVGVLAAGVLAWSLRAPTASAAAPLELLSLRHEQSTQGLAIAGVVRNPPRGRRMTDVSVIVFAFDRDGSLVSSVVEPIDFRTLAPGDESPFTISLGETGAVGRYRVSFKAADAVIPHVDRRRNPATMARHQ